MSVLMYLTESMMSVPGAIGVAIVDIETGQTLAKAGHISTDIIETTGVVNARFLRFKISQLVDQPGQDVEDILMTLTNEYHIVRLIRRPEQKTSQFLYLALERQRANLALSRRKLITLDEDLNEFADNARLMGIECDYIMNVDNLRTKIERVFFAQERGTQGNDTDNDINEDMPPFMCTDLALKLLGVDINK